MQRITMGAGVGRMSRDKQSRARVARSVSALDARLAYCHQRSRSRYCVSDVQHPDGRKATNRIDALPQRFRLFVGLWRMEAPRARYKCNSAMTTQPLLMKVPSRSSRATCCSSTWVFITVGPYQATGSRSGFSETSRNRIPSSPASTVTSSPLSKRTSDRLPVRSRA